MCGRFTLTVDVGTIYATFNITSAVFDYSPRYNIAPGQNIIVITGDTGERVGSIMKWGLVPHWAKDPKIRYKMINARAETIDQKPAFKSAFLHRRCLIPTDGFYEWKHEGKSKQPMRITLPDGVVFGFAGIWEHWDSPDGNTVYSCSIITTAANEYVREIHDRMPVILSSEQEYETWLTSDEPVTLKELLHPYPGGYTGVSSIYNGEHR